MAGTGVALGLATVAAAAEPQTRSPAAGPEPLCRTSDDPTYGFSRDRAIQVGGGAMYAAARERRYLDTLRGPQGDVVRYTRQGSSMLDDGDTLVDVYSVTYDGLAAPLTLYLDAYHYTEPLAPRGFICGRSLSLGLPPPDEIRGTSLLDALAAEIAAAPGFRAGPVDLGGDPPIGLLLDAFRVRSRRQRAAASPSATASAPSRPDVRTVVVAFPQTCGARVVSPSAIALVGPQGHNVEALATETAIAAVRASMPGQQIPAGSISATFEVDALLQQAQVRVTFADPACAASATRETALVYTPAQLVESPMPARPAGDTSGVPWVAVQAVIDHQGTFQQVRALGGPPALVRLAEDTVRAWKARPSRAGEAPIASIVTVQVTFTAPSPR